MSETPTPYDRMMPRDQFQQAVDKAIEEANADYLERSQDPVYAAAEEEVAARWAAWLAARRDVGVHGIVLPMATAKELLAVLRGEPSMLVKPLLIKMLEHEITEQERD